MGRLTLPPIRSARLLAGLALGGLLAAPAPSLAQDLPTQVDDPGLSVTTTADPDRATGWGCTRKTLLSGDQCVFEGAEQPAGAGRKKAAAKANTELAASLGQQLCTDASRPAPREEPNKDLAALCRADFKKALAASCVLDGPALADGQGRFTPASKPCYFALGEVLRNTARIATTGTACCNCAVANSCVQSAHACLRLLSEDPPVLPKCAPAECYENCSHLLPHSGPAAKSAKGAPGQGKPGATQPDGHQPPQQYPYPYADPYQQGPHPPYATPYGQPPNVYVP